MGISCSYNNRRKKHGKDRNQIKNKENNNPRIIEVKLIKDKSEISIIYNINYNKNIKIFGSEFVKNNKYNCKMIIDNKETEIAEEYNFNNYNNNILKIILKGINNVTNMSYMFCGCSSLSNLPDISKWNINNVTNMSYMFCGCSSLSNLPVISKWNINNVTNMSYMFCECSSLSNLPDISKWITNNVTNMNSMFCGCSSLSNLPDISKWNINNVTNMNSMFCGCSSLSNLPDIME